VVSKRLEARVRNDFPSATAEDVLRRLGSLNLGTSGRKQDNERIQAAIVLLSAGDPDKLDYNVKLAETDWRDVLVFSGLGDEDWSTRLDTALGPPYFRLTS
jgi:hypothetical protein